MNDKKNIVRRFTICFLLLCCCWVTTQLLVSCARMGNPDGGWFDDTPPYVVGSSPEDRGIDVKSKRVTIYFNEFIKLEDAQNKVIISPPQLEMADIKASGKRIIVDLRDSLKPNMTYTIDFSDAISDNNEGNPMGNYTFSFSTGKNIDTLQVSGYALDASNLEPIKGMLVGLYPDSTFVDSTFHKVPMSRVSRTNGSGRFVIKGVAPGRYFVRALQDADGNFVFSQKSEMIGFNSDTIVPSSTLAIRQDTTWRDSLHIEKITPTEYTRFLPDDITLLCFQELQTFRSLIKTERKEPEKFSFYFSYGSDSLPVIRGLNFNADSAFVIEASEKLDTIHYWLRDTALVNQDTLRMEAIYMMTDTTGLLISKTDTIEAMPKVPYAKRLKNKQKEIEKWEKEQEKKKKRDEPYDSIMPPEFIKVKISASSQMSPLQNIYFEFPTPLDSCNMEAVHLYSMIDSVWYRSPHVFEQISARQYVLKAEWRPGTEYSLEVDSLAFTDIYGLTSKPIKQGVKVSTEDQFSSLFINLSNVPDSGTVFVQMMDNGDKVVRQEKVVDNTVEFYYVRPGKYYLRAFVDYNGNGIWDTGNYDSGLQAEPVFYNNEQVECKMKWDVNRKWSLTALPRYRQKPQSITKQKPDQAKKQQNRNAQRAAEKGIPYPIKTK